MDQALKVQNLQEWIEKNQGNKSSREKTYKFTKDNNQIKIYYVGDNDERNYFHMQEAEELYYVFKGELVLRCLDSTGVSKDIHIMEGEIFLLPSKILHCVRKCENLIALVIERERLPNEMDNISWYTLDSRTSNESLHNLSLSSRHHHHHNKTSTSGYHGDGRSPTSAELFIGTDNNNNKNYEITRRDSDEFLGKVTSGSAEPLTRDLVDFSADPGEGGHKSLLQGKTADTKPNLIEPHSPHFYPATLVNKIGVSTPFSAVHSISKSHEDILGSSSKETPEAGLNTPTNLQTPSHSPQLKTDLMPQKSFEDQTDDGTKLGTSKAFATTPSAIEVFTPIPENETLAGPGPSTFLSTGGLGSPRLFNKEMSSSSGAFFNISGQPFVPLTALKKRSPSIISNSENFHVVSGPRLRLLTQTWFHCFDNFRDVNHAIQVLKGREKNKPFGSDIAEEIFIKEGQAEFKQHKTTDIGYKPCSDLEDDIHPPVALELWIQRHNREITDKGCLSLFDEDDYQVKVLIYGAGEHIGRNNAADIFVWQYTGLCTFQLNDEQGQVYKLKKKDALVVPRGTSFTATNQPNALTLHIVIDPRKKN